MGYAIERVNGWSAMYRTADGRRRTAGLFPTEREAREAAHKAEGRTPVPEKVRAPRPTKDRSLRLREHVMWWLKHETDLMPSTLRGYEKQFYDYILPAFGDRTVASIKKADIEEWFGQLRAQGRKPWVLAQCKSALGRSLRPLVGTLIAENPCHGIRVLAPAQRDFELIENEEFARILEHLPTEGSQEFAAFLIRTGARFGEAAEIRVSDISFRSREVRIERRVILAPASSISRFEVHAGTKAGKNRIRSVPIPEKYAHRLKEWILSNDLESNDLVFSDLLVRGHLIPERDTSEPVIGTWFYRSGGRRYQHGTAVACIHGGCRCRACRAAARAEEDQKPSPQSKRRANDTGHLPNEAWRKIWNKAVNDAGLDWRPRTHDLRHYYATILLAQGLDVHSVKTQMGHTNLNTTERYLHKVRSQQSVARDIIDNFPG